MLVDFLDICNTFGCGNNLKVLFLWENTSGEYTEGIVHFFVIQHAILVLSRVQIKFPKCSRK